MGGYGWLVRLVEDIATTPGIATSARRELLVDALAPLGPGEAARVAGEIEEHAFWLRAGVHASGHDAAFGVSVDQAVRMAGRALSTGPGQAVFGAGASWVAER